ncbi:GAF domain-containing protein [Paraburkholderia edwinii]|nr:GAF domain-containing protein [Paraburkholderia edwinii]
MENDVLTTTEAARLMGVSVRTAQLLIEGGTLRSWKTPGGHRRVYRADVLAFVAQHDETPDEFNSARVVLVAPPAQIARCVEWLSAVEGCTVDAYSDAQEAAFAIGLRLPAVVVVDLRDAVPGGQGEPGEEGKRAAARKRAGERRDPIRNPMRSDCDERAALVAQLAAQPALGASHIVTLGGEGDARHDEHANADAKTDALAAAKITRIEHERALPAAVRNLLRDRDAAALQPDPDASYPVAPNEAQRLVALERAGFVDTPPEDAFDRLTWLASRALKAPIALLTVLTAQRQWFKSRYGLEGFTETPRSWALCNHTILQRDVLVASNLADDPRFSDNPAVAGGPCFRFYAGAPVVDQDGFALGSLCVMDYEPRELDEEARETLAALAALASDELRLRATDRQLRWALDALSRKQKG